MIRSRDRRTGRRALAVAAYCLLTAGISEATEQESRQLAAQQFHESLAHHIGTLAYVYGYPIVDLSKQMHNETHAVTSGQQVLAPVNRFSRFESLVTPTTQGNLRGPNNDTLYFSGWFDLSEGPVLLHAPDTAGRYYTMSVTNFYGEIEHLGRRTTGTREQYFALVGPEWGGELPAGVRPVVVETRRAWILGRILVDGEPDFPAALALLKEFWAAPLAEWNGKDRPTMPAPASGDPADPFADLEFFVELDRFLRANPRRASEAAVLAQFARIGLGAGNAFQLEALDPATRRGFERALESGRALVEGAALAPPKAVNGWIILADGGRYGHDFLLRAAVAMGGYTNLPEESVYPARISDEKGRPLLGTRKYRLHFPADAMPPVNGFWSVAVYDAQTSSLVENPIGRYSIGDRSRGLRRGADGSLTLYLQHEVPKSGPSNWLPTPAGPFMTVIRLYEPKASVLDGRYKLPEIHTVDE
jgi:hypothetical protein